MLQLPELPFKLSHTNLSDYDTCPSRFVHKHVWRDVYDKKGAGAVGGTKAHTAIKKRLKLREPLGTGFEALEPMCASVEEMPGIHMIEENLAIDRDGKACDYNDPKAVLRGVLDCVISHSPQAFLLDWKSNKKPWEDPSELKLHALLLRARYPDLTVIKGAFFWLMPNKLGHIYETELNDTANTWAELCKTGESIARRIRNGDWPPDKNPLCSWCPVNSCPHWKPSP